MSMSRSLATAQPSGAEEGQPEALPPGAVDAEVDLAQQFVRRLGRLAEALDEDGVLTGELPV
jgi:hypothetical protein